MAGVMYVSVHGAQNLLALDRNGFSDPYCIIFSNGKKVSFLLLFLSKYLSGVLSHHNCSFKCVDSDEV